MQSTEEEIIRATEIGQTVSFKFKTLARMVLSAEKRWFSSWSESINMTAMQHLKQPIFRRASPRAATPMAGVEGAAAAPPAPAPPPPGKPPATGGSAVAADRNARVEVNFHADLIQLIRETRYLDRMGFHIPEIALNVALQVGARGGEPRPACTPSCPWAPPAPLRCPPLRAALRGWWLGP